MLKILKKIKSFLFEYDFLWSIPVAFVGFILFPIVGQLIWGEGFGSYSPEFFHAGIYAGLIVVLTTSFVQMGMFFQFPELYQYYLKDFNEIEQKWLKPIIFLTVYFFYFLFFFLIWRAVV